MRHQQIEKGITLIALVITIIVLIILAGVTIATLSGPNGILTQANEAKKRTEQASGIEQVKIAVMGSFGPKGNLDYEELKTNLSGIEGVSGLPETIVESDFPLTITVGNTSIRINQDGSVPETVLPSGYEQVEYIQGTGTQYIDTGFKANQDTSVEMDIKMTDLIATQTLYCSRTSHQVNTFSMFIINGNYRFDYDTILSTIPSSNLGNERTIIYANKNKCYLNGELKATQQEKTFQSDGTMWLMACYGNSSGSGSTNFGKYELYGTKIWDNDKLIRNLIPCIHSEDNVAGLYDIINDVFYTNRGTGEFLVGDKV